MHSSTISFRRAVPEDYPGMRLLQAENLVDNLDTDEKQHGFLSIEYTKVQFDEINRDLGISVAVRDQQVIGYLCATTFRYALRFPILSELIANLRDRVIDQTPINEKTTFIYGPVCIARSMRGSGVLSSLFAVIRKLARPRFRQCVLFVSDSNPRSVNAHRKLGMRDLGRFMYKGGIFHMLGGSIEETPYALKRDQKLTMIADEIRACKECKRGGSGLPVPGEGSGESRVIFVGEAPGREEAKTGRPFVGRSGKFLRGMIRAAGLDEGKVFIASPVHYLPDSGKPSPAMIEHGTTHLRKQIEAIRPNVIVLLGNSACRALLGRDVEIAKLHGTVIEQEGVRFLITFHPAYAMRFPDGKQKFTQDFEKLKDLITRQQC